MDQLSCVVRLVHRHTPEAFLILVCFRGLVLVGAAADVHRAAGKRIHAAAVLAVDHHGHAVRQVQRRAAAHRHQTDAVLDQHAAAGFDLHNVRTVQRSVLDSHCPRLDVERAPVGAAVRGLDGLPAQVDDDRFVYVHTGRQRVDIRQQRHRVAGSSRVYRRLESSIADLTDLGDRFADDPPVAIFHGSFAALDIFRIRFSRILAAGDEAGLISPGADP